MGCAEETITPNIEPYGSGMGVRDVSSDDPQSEMYSLITKATAMDFKNLHVFYTDELNQHRDKSYYWNLKNIIIKLIFDADMIEKGKPEHFEFYTKELFEMKFTFLNLTNFYSLLNTQIEREDTEKLKNYSDTFYEKNMAAINRIDITAKPSGAEGRNALKKKLEDAYYTFNRDLKLNEDRLEK